MEENVCFYTLHFIITCYCVVWWITTQKSSVTVPLINQFDGRLKEEFNQKLSVDGKSSAKLSFQWLRSASGHFGLFLSVTFLRWHSLIYLKMFVQHSSYVEFMTLILIYCRSCLQFASLLCNIPFNWRHQTCGNVLTSYW